jgi:hypothetical protein
MSMAASPTATHAEPMHREEDTGKGDPQSVVRKEFGHFCCLPLAIGSPARRSPTLDSSLCNADGQPSCHNRRPRLKNVPHRILNELRALPGFGISRGKLGVLPRRQTGSPWASISGLFVDRRATTAVG